MVITKQSNVDYFYSSNITSIKFIIFANMGTYPKHRKPAGLRECPDCGHLIKARGLHGHRALVHNVIVKTIEKTLVNDMNTRLIYSSNNSSSDMGNKDKTQAVSENTDKDLSECKRSDGEPLYTDIDLRIFISYLISHTYNPGSEVTLFNQFTLMDIIEDFEHRFECKFIDIRKANYHGKISVDMGTTPEEHWLFANKYSSLKYSR